MEKTDSKEPTIKWENKNKNKGINTQSDKIDPSTIKGKTTINQKCLNKTNLSMKGSWLKTETNLSMRRFSIKTETNLSMRSLQKENTLGKEKKSTTSDKNT